MANKKTTTKISATKKPSAKTLAVASSKKKSSEFRAYPWITKRLRQKGWNTSNPNANKDGEVWTQQECLQHPQIKKALGLQKPENVVRISSTEFWVIEAKPGKDGLDEACREAMEYADQINKTSSQAHIATGVAGDEEAGFESRHYLCLNGKWKKIMVGVKPATGFLTKNEIQRLVAQKTENLVRDDISQRDLIALSNYINKQLHLAKITKENRAILVAILLIALHQDPSLKKTDAKVFLNDINSRAETIFRNAGKDDLWNKVKITFTAGETPEIAEALSRIVQALREADIIESIDKSDVLGPFFESFLRYGNTSKDLGIVLTPRHICWLAAESLGIRTDDVVYDPAVGTGGFLIAAFNRIKKTADATKAKSFAEKNIYGSEVGSHIAALAFVNMFFRGDGKHNLSFKSCFDYELNRAGKGVNAKFEEKGASKNRVNKRLVTRVLMNPPFSLKDTKEKEPDFIDHALDQMVEGALLFSILPASVFYEQKHEKWRKRLLEENTLMASVGLPIDVFYPVATHSIAVIIKKGVPHEKNAKVLWARIEDDGFVKRKGFRVEQRGIDYRMHLKPFSDSISEWVLHQRESGALRGVREFSPITGEELIPQAQLGTGTVTPDPFKDAVNKLLKGMTFQMWEQQEKLQNVLVVEGK